MRDRTASESTTAQPPRRAPAGVLQVVNLEAAEHEWEIFPGMVMPGYAFNSQVPGPVIEARVGDTLLVRHTNLLPEPTAIHWHGLRVRAATAGSEPAEEPVPPGGCVHYRFDLPDAGTFWYRSYLHGTTQPVPGLCGVLVVRDPGEPVVDGEQVLLFDDFELNRQGHLAAPTGLRKDVRGFEGDVLLVNGVRKPKMQIPAGQVERWRLVNATSARQLRLSLGGHRFHLIGTVGPTPQTVDELPMNPGDRFDLVVGPFPSGETVVLEALPDDRCAGELPHLTLATLYVAPPDSPSEAPGVNPGSLVRPPAQGGAGHAVDLDFPGGGMDTLKGRALDREEG